MRWPSTTRSASTSNVKRDPCREERPEAPCRKSHQADAAESPAISHAHTRTKVPPGLSIPRTTTGRVAMHRLVLCLPQHSLPQARHEIRRTVKRGRLGSLTHEARVLRAGTRRCFSQLRPTRPTTWCAGTLGNAFVRTSARPRRHRKSVERRPHGGCRSPRGSRHR
jgi:hypothetical protein